MKTKLKPLTQAHCSHCGSTDVFFDAYADWDVETQCFYVQNVMDKGHFCMTCEGECSIDWRDLNDN